jgi:N-acetylneuraminate synthase
MCTPWDLNSVGALETLGVLRYKIASADFDNVPLIESLIQTQKPLIFSTGMSSDSEIQKRIDWLNAKQADFTIMHCNSTYPAPFEDIELPYILRLKEFTDKIGYSGHERGIAVSIAAVTLGAQVIERHLTEDKSLEGPDHQASLTPDEFKQMVDMSRQVCKAMQVHKSGFKSLSQGALLNREVLGKSIVASKDLKIGKILSEADLEVRSPGQGLPPSELENVIGKKLIMPLSKHEFLTQSHLKKLEKNGMIAFNSLKWGIPVRPHDIFSMHKLFDAEVYEFHISYKDLERPLPLGEWHIFRNKKILVHAPELFEKSKLLDLTDKNHIEDHIENLNRVCDFSRELRSKISYDGIINIIANIGGFSTHDFKPLHERSVLYDRVLENLNRIDETHCNIIIQNMAPFPWHFGGQRYQNIFSEPMEIIEFCIRTGRKITLDTSHLSMYCSYMQQDFEAQFMNLLPHTAHLHVADALGNNGEGVELGTGDINFKTIINSIYRDQTFIVETWQGHKEFGTGFRRDLNFLAELEV